MIKVYGRNPNNPDAKNDSRILQRTLNRLHGQVLVPRGLYRFTSFQDGDVAQYEVVRIADEYVVDLMASKSQLPLNNY
ncbi:MAG: hypothetical protein COV45_06485 [Deltaproteobacteria bacterium CG11_big_fil_rev_8_21_14_0_20_47_16]|nr:MAG: hypothetical protein COV45_06485 [Deltaproteobacteria bacterium CG11_big_fil_rev_8_21_14_0_20_47_16]